MQAKPGREHHWLDRMAGEWTVEAECDMGPGQPLMKSNGVESVRSLGGFWIIAEGTGDAPGGVIATSIMTLGYDPKSERFVGTFVSSMMSHLWVYNGSLDAAEKVLTLDADGPAFTGEGTSRYKDFVEFVSDDHRVMSSRYLGEDGNWTQFMTAHYRRKN